MKNKMSSVLSFLAVIVLPASSVSPFPLPTVTPVDPYAGPYATASAEYRFPAAIDNNVLAGVATEVWGKLYRPTNSRVQKLQLIVLLHGNHETCGFGANPIQAVSCEYTFSGSCSGDGQFVIQNHLGFEYLATELASWGYAVVSINANRGITCGNPATGDNGLNLARGRLLLKHLSLLSQWNRNANTTPGSLGVDLHGKLDFTQVGLFGHSRGGEGVRAAYNLYRDSGSIWPSMIATPVNFRGIFEVGPVDGQTARVLNADGAAWNVLLPMCDGDVVQLQGMKVFDRMQALASELPPLPKSMYAVWGANHDYYNTQWQTSDSQGCVGMTPLWNGSVGSSNERLTAQNSVIPFFRAHVGVNHEVSLASSFDPMYPLPDAVSEITRVDRTFMNSPNRQFSYRAEDFQGTGLAGSLTTAAPLVSNVIVTHANVTEHDPSLKAARITWTRASAQTYFQDNWTLPGHVGLNLREAATFDFRVSRSISNMNPVEQSTDFMIQAAFDDGSFGDQVPVAEFISLDGPFGSVQGTSSELHETLQTVRIPTAQFVGGSPHNVKGVRFTFNLTNTGDIVISDINISRFSSNVAASGFNYNPANVLPLTFNPSDLWANLIRLFPHPILSYFGPRLSPGEPRAVVPVRGIAAAPPRNQVIGVRRSADGLKVKIDIQSSEIFQVRDALPVLRFAGKAVAPGEFMTNGDLHYMSFTVDRAELQILPASFAMDISHQEDMNHAIRDFGIVKRADFP